MPNSIAELQRAVYEAFQRHDLDAMLAHIDEDVEFLPMLRDAEAREVYRGRAAMRRYYETIFETFPDYTARVERSEELPELDGILSLTTVHGTGAASGLALDQAAWLAARLRGDKVVWWGFWRSREEALAALREAAASSVG